MRAPDQDLPIEFKQVSFAARQVPIVQDVDLRITAGPPTVLIGPNGSGKTTLLRLAMGLIAPSTGSLTWGGREQVAPARRAIMLQRPVMLRRSAIGNVAYALSHLPRRERRARAEALLAMVGLAALAERPARRLSGGEQQRLALARALARDPTVLFLDEPTASLDPAATKHVEDVIGGAAARGIKIVMSTHDRGQAQRLAGDIVLMQRGRIAEHAPGTIFFAQPASEAARRFLAGELLI